MEIPAAVHGKDSTARQPGMKKNEIAAGWLMRANAIEQSDFRRRVKGRLMLILLRLLQAWGGATLAYRKRPLIALLIP